MLVNQRLMTGKARDEKFRVSDAQLQQFIAAIPAFQDEGSSRPSAIGSSSLQNMSPPMFEQRMRQVLLVGAVQEPIASANIVARPSVLKYLGLLEQQREVAVAPIEPRAVPEGRQGRRSASPRLLRQEPGGIPDARTSEIEYVLLSQDALIAQSTVDAAEVKKQYDANVKQYTAPEERSAAHILIAVKPDAKDDEKTAAKKLADEVYAKVKANPAKFGELAKEYSKDPGSAEQGGDLGNFGRGAMVKPFEDAVFAAKAGDLLPPVQSDFGWHIIKVTVCVRCARSLSMK